MTSISSSTTCEIIKPYKESIVTVPNDSCMITETKKSNDAYKFKLYSNVYQYILSVYMGKMSIEDAAERVHDLYDDVSIDSFKMYYNTYKKMRLGELYTRSISQDLHIILLEGIYKDYGKEGLKTALKAYLAHIEHYKKNGNDRVIYEKYAQKII